MSRFERSRVDWSSFSFTAILGPELLPVVLMLMLVGDLLGIRLELDLADSPLLLYSA